MLSYGFIPATASLALTGPESSLTASDKRHQIHPKNRNKKLSRNNGRNRNYSNGNSPNNYHPSHHSRRNHHSSHHKGHNNHNGHTKSNKPIKSPTTTVTHPQPTVSFPTFTPVTLQSHLFLAEIVPIAPPTEESKEKIISQETKNIN